MGHVAGAALVSHHPGLMQNEDIRKMAGAGADSDLIKGYARLREKIQKIQPDAVIIFDSHWFTTGYNLIDGGERYSGNYISDEMPWYLYGVPYDYRGHPELALAIDSVGQEKGVKTRAICNPDLPRAYATINVIKLLQLERMNIPVVSASCCQNCKWHQFLPAGEIVGEAIRRGPWKVVLLASGALSHVFTNIEWEQQHPRIYHEDNVSSQENVESDKRAIKMFEEGRHDLIIENWDSDFRKRHWEAFGGHYLQMLGAMGGTECRAKGEVLSEYENARGTGNIHVWFDTEEAA
jgi:3,4-dihydroxyphenylacetate 2,3-dioxygenase